ncbi:RidA family protein [Oceanospirillum linum]|uniref:Reactive intermediate/imine deaminase n=1 Tax=Oceanospirillum linum TaxID=966 RepID=A0A1T1HDR4_OCELI|nr:RidA family protein [Oceanospirillum linum]OOV88004.1 reactive intermediate/imine deaminase [Oceanospirillum linum]SEF40143.1 Enamine deaminase RidA, house cleaning of reactive enamine intermediates, YjgF/YER057c/UK114 family [Oleiphilus messinensis]SMP00436.1 Enamine deaminase RidA, house cleaning of reactive enamine intermediates, YjgF/YER057c/UK114 family [Oceanospirillum linum]
MIHTVQTDLYASSSPLEWATIGNGILFTAQIPIDDKGRVVEGGVEAQARQTLDNLKHTLEKAGAGMQNLTQVLIYVTDKSYLPVVNKVYAEYMQEPYPNRAALVVAGLARDEMLVEMVAYAAL